MNCSRNDIVLLPIPFTDLSSHKVRPAIVIGHGPDPRDIFVVPITSRLQQATFPLRDWKSCGLNVPSTVKGQLATVESKLVRRVTGHLAKSDAANLDRHLRHWLKLGSE
jgi:mRNA interferase MazF